MAGVTAGGALSLDIHTDVVENALDAEDFTPLVRVVFDAVASSMSTATTKQALLTRAAQATPALDSILEDEALAENGNGSGRRASDRLKAMRKEAAAPVVTALEKVVETRSAELSQICRGNAEEIVSSLQELDAMQEGAAELRERIEAGDAAMRDAGDLFLNGLEQLQDLRGLQASVTASCQAVGAARQLLQLCAQAGRAVNANELYRAFKLLQRAEQEFLSLSDDGDGHSHDHSSESSQHRRLTEGRLHDFLQARVQEMQAAIQDKAVRDFNVWLVSAREQAREIGLLALRKAAWSRQRDETLLAQRRRLAAELSNVQSPETAAAEYARPLSARSAGSAKLDPAVHPAAAALLDSGRPDPFGDELAGIEMTQLHRCLQMHACLGKTAAFQEYYQMNRQMQLNNDLGARGNFLTQYQSYLAQLVGFFVIEDRVSKAAETLSGPQVDAGWETAVAYLKLALDTAFAAVDSTSTMLAIKDHVLLACSALGDRGFHVAPLLDALTAARPRHHELLCHATAAEVRAIVSTSRNAPCTVETAARAAELAGSFGLPLSLREGAGQLGPTPPFQAPFSRMLPELLLVVRNFIDAGAAFARGVVGPAEMLSAVRLQRDAMLLELPLPTLDAALDGGPAHGLPALDDALQSLADLNVLMDALQPLDDYTFHAVRGADAKERWVRVASRSLSTTIGRTASIADAAKASPQDAKAAIAEHNMVQGAKCSAGLTGKFQELQAKAEQRLRAVLAAQLRHVLGAVPPVEWLPDRPVKTASSHTPHVLELQRYLKATLEKVATKVSVSSYRRVGQILMHLVGQLLLDSLLRDEVAAYNLYGLFRLNDDALALAEFANKVDIPGLEVGLREVIQFCDLMVTGRLEDILDGKKRVRDYPAIDPRHLLILLRKFREVTPSRDHASSLALRRPHQPASFLKKKTVDKVSKQLRMYLEAAGSMPGPKQA